MIPAIATAIIGGTLVFVMAFGNWFLRQAWWLRLVAALGWFALLIGLAIVEHVVMP